MENNLSIVKDQFKELPNNIEAEQAVIGSILVSNDIYDDWRASEARKIAMEGAESLWSRNPESERFSME